MCPFAHEDEYTLQLHIEETHFSDDSPFVVREEAPQPQGSDNHDEFLACPEEGCGEQVLWSEMQEHLDFHLAEKLGVDAVEQQSSPSQYMYAYHFHFLA